MNNVTGFLRLVRVENLVIVLVSQYLTAAFLVAPHGSEVAYLLDPKMVLIAVSTLLIAAAGYIINDYYDIKIDLINKPERVVIGKIISRRIALFIHTLFNFLGIALGILIDPIIGLIHLTSAFLLWIYSNQMKRMPLLGNMIVSFLTGLTLLLIPIAYASNYLLPLSYAILAMAITMIRELIKDMEDAEGDSAFGAHTFPVLHGIRKTKLVLYFLMVIFVILLGIMAYKLKNYTFTVYMILLFIPSLYFAYRLIQADKVRDYRFLSAFCKVLMVSGITSMIFF